MFDGKVRGGSILTAVSATALGPYLDLCGLASVPSVFLSGNAKNLGPLAPTSREDVDSRFDDEDEFGTGAGIDRATGIELGANGRAVRFKPGFL